MTPEQLDEARAKEALRRLVDSGKVYCHEDIAALGARLAREGWTPAEPVDPDVLAFREWLEFREWLAGHNCSPSKRILIDRGHYDNDLEATPYLAGARMAREQERERAKPLVEYVQDRRYEDAQADRIHARYTGRRCDD